MNDIQQLTVNAIRVLSAEAIDKANSGHPGTSARLRGDRLHAVCGQPRPQPEKPVLFQPRPLYPQRGSRLGASVHAAAPFRLRRDDGGYEKLPSVRFAHSGSPRSRAHPGNHKVYAKKTYRGRKRNDRSRR